MGEKKLYNCKLTAKEIQHILFMRKKFPFGRIEVVVHAGEPQKSIEKERENIYDGNLKVDEKLQIK